MPWKTEIDRLVHHLVLDAAKGGPVDQRRAVRAIADLVALSPTRPESQFHAGVLEELGLPTTAEGDEDASAVSVPAAAPGASERWRYLGRLDAASRRGGRERVRELMDDGRFEETVATPEGRVALRAVGRSLLRDGEDQRAFDLYARHLRAVSDDGSRRDAEFLLEDALRRADRGEAGEDDALVRLQRAGAFATAAGLDSRAQGKVDRKLGRVHQLAERWDEAVACYRSALERLPADDPYRSVLVGDLALATLGVRGTLDLVPQADRPQRAEAERLLEEGAGGEGRSYNAIYTLGLLAYERGDWARAAESFREADRLMRENRAKARIVHARSRFFLGRCLLELGAEGEDLEAARQAIQREAGAVSLDADAKGAVLDALAARVPAGRGRGGRGAPRGRGGEEGRPGAVDHLAAARAALAEDPHQALNLVDRAFKSRPDFETWFGAYQTRLDALLSLGEKEEALRTYERFRAKLVQREAGDRVEALLGEGGLRDLLGPTGWHEERVDLLETLPERAADFVEACLGAAEEHLKSGEPKRLARAVAILREAAARAPSDAGPRLKEAEAAAERTGAALPAVTREEARALLEPEEEPVRILVVGGDEGRKSHHERLEALAKDLGFEVEWIATGVMPPYKTLREIEAAADDSDVILLHHRAGPDLVADIEALSQKIDIPVHRASWLGLENLEREALAAVKAVFMEEEQPA
jgi:tetratricopeptide (TPR) repeat protein